MHRVAALLLIVPLTLAACDDDPGGDPKCVKSSYNCAFDNPLGGNRVRHDDGKSEIWTVEQGALLRDGNGAPIYYWDESKPPPGGYEWQPYKASFNFGQTRTLAGEPHALATYSPNMSAAWLPLAAIVDRPEFESNVGKATLGGGSLKKMGCYVIKDAYDADYGALKVTKPPKYDEKHMRADDYLARPRANGRRSVNLIYHVPGSGLGGTAIDHFPVGTRFQRLRVPMFKPDDPPSITIPLWKKDYANKTWIKSQKTMKFLYGFVATKTGERRYGWMAFEALKTAGKSCTIAKAAGNDQPQPPPDLPPPPDPMDPPPPPDPCTECVNTSCGGTLAACDGNPECGAIYECVDSCPEACLSCWPGCWQQHPGGKDSFTAHQECTQQHCYNVCNTDDPCYAQTVACNGNPECAAIFACIKATCPAECPPDNPSCALPCWAGCMEQHPTAKDQFTQLSQCENSGC